MGNVFDYVRFGFDVLRMAMGVVERVKEAHEAGYDLSRLKPEDVVSTDALDEITGEKGSQTQVDEWLNRGEG